MASSICSGGSSRLEARGVEARLRAMEGCTASTVGRHCTSLLERTRQQLQREPWGLRSAARQHLTPPDATTHDQPWARGLACSKGSSGSDLPTFSYTPLKRRTTWGEEGDEFHNDMGLRDDMVGGRAMQVPRRLIAHV